jgi:hypothetical protein
MLARVAVIAIVKAMAVEQLSDSYWRMAPGPIDVHGHPRVCDALNPDNFVPLNNGTEGKAGLVAYTEAALRAGIVAVVAMPNEVFRNQSTSAVAPEQTVTFPFPIANLDRVRTMQNGINQQAVIPTGVYMGLDPETALAGTEAPRVNKPLLTREFSNVKDECLGLKVYLAQTTGGYNIDLAHAAEVAGIWYRHNPEKPVIYHVEGENVAKLMTDLRALKHGKLMPSHLAHVSSRVELSAKIAAKESGMNVTCEATPHHLFLHQDMVRALGGYGCMKPSLKTEDDRAFLWDNMEHIDIFASDCAPHRRSDKEAENPAFGVTNHGVMLPLLLGAVANGRLTMDDIYQKFCVAPRERFNLPLYDGSYIGISTAVSHNVERYEVTPYGFSPFGKLEAMPAMVGEVVVAHGGNSTYRANREKQDFVTSYTHLIRPA